MSSTQGNDSVNNDATTTSKPPFAAPSAGSNGHGEHQRTAFDQTLTLPGLEASRHAPTQDSSEASVTATLQTMQQQIQQLQQSNVMQQQIRELQQQNWELQKKNWELQQHQQSSMQNQQPAQQRRQAPPPSQQLPQRPLQQPSQQPSQQPPQYPAQIPPQLSHEQRYGNPQYGFLPYQPPRTQSYGTPAPAYKPGPQFEARDRWQDREHGTDRPRTERPRSRSPGHSNQNVRRRGKDVPNPCMRCVLARGLRNHTAAECYWNRQVPPNPPQAPSSTPQTSSAPSQSPRQRHRDPEERRLHNQRRKKKLRERRAAAKTVSDTTTPQGVVPKLESNVATSTLEATSRPSPIEPSTAGASNAGASTRGASSPAS